MGTLQRFSKVLEAAADFFVEGAGDHMGSMLRETLVRLAEVEGGGHNNMMKDEAIAARKKKKQKWVPVWNHRFKRAYFVVSMNDSFGISIILS